MASATSSTTSLPDAVRRMRTVVDPSNPTANAVGVFLLSFPAVERDDAAGGTRCGDGLFRPPGCPTLPNTLPTPLSTTSLILGSGPNPLSNGLTGTGAIARYPDTGPLSSGGGGFVIDDAGGSTGDKCVDVNSDCCVLSWKEACVSSCCCCWSGMGAG